MVDRVPASHPARPDEAVARVAAEGTTVIRVLLADDNAFVRDGLAELFLASNDIEVVASCADGDEVVQAARATHPDIVVLDVAMPRMGGLEAARQLLAVQPDARVVFLTADASASTRREARDVGAVSYLLKDLGPDELCQAVRTAALHGTAHPNEWGSYRNSVTATMPDGHRR